MKPLDWMIAVLLIIAGLACLTMASTGMIAGNSIGAMLRALLTICFWITIPLFVIGMLYTFLIKRK